MQETSRDDPSFISTISNLCVSLFFFFWLAWLEACQIYWSFQRTWFWLCWFFFISLLCLNLLPSPLIVLISSNCFRVKDKTFRFLYFSGSLKAFFPPAYFSILFIKNMTSAAWIKRKRQVCGQLSGVTPHGGIWKSKASSWLVLLCPVIIGAETSEAQLKCCACLRTSCACQVVLSLGPFQRWHLSVWSCGVRRPQHGSMSPLSRGRRGAQQREAGPPPDHPLQVSPARVSLGSQE